MAGRPEARRHALGAPDGDARPPAAAHLHPRRGRAVTSPPVLHGKCMWHNLRPTASTRCRVVATTGFCCQLVLLAVLLAAHKLDIAGAVRILEMSACGTHREVDGDLQRGPPLVARQLLVVIPQPVLLQLLLVGKHHEACLQAVRVVARKVLVAEVACMMACCTVTSRNEIQNNACIACFVAWCMNISTTVLPSHVCAGNCIRLWMQPCSWGA